MSPTGFTETKGVLLLIYANKLTFVCIGATENASSKEFFFFRYGFNVIVSFVSMYVKYPHVT